MLFWFRSHGKTDLDSGPLADAMLQSTGSQEQKLPASPFEDCMHFIKTGPYKKNLVSFSLSTHKTKVTCTCQLTLGSIRQINGCLGQNNLKIIGLFYKRSQEYQTSFQIMLKYYISLGSNRDLGWFGEFPHIALKPHGFSGKYMHQEFWTSCWIVRHCG